MTHQAPISSKPNTPPNRPTLRRLRGIVFSVGVTLLLMLPVLPVVRAALASPQEAGTQALSAGPDLTAEILLDPPNPQVGQPTDIIFRIRNVGDASTGGQVQFGYYLNPGTKPPYGQVNARPGSVPPISAGGSTDFIVEDYEFDSQGCDYDFYIWLDPNNDIAEGDEENNQIGRPVCAGVECEPDAYDVSDQQNDNQCSVAGWMSDGAVQNRSFCNPVNKNEEDTDWIKFTAFAGLTYTLGSSNEGQFARPIFNIRSSCGGGDLASGEGVSWQAPVSGVYFAQITNGDGVQGPLTAYSLTLTSVTGLTDAYEPDNECANARDITTDGLKQSHLFQDVNDVDWIKFTTSAGESFAIVTDETATGVNPVISLYNSCTQARSSASVAVAQAPARVEANSPAEQTFYARINNQDPNRFGADASYKVSVLAAQCSDDVHEENDIFNQAKDLLLDTPQSHEICPAGDRDWVKVALDSTSIYVVETSNLASDADTVITLYDDQGSQLAVNDDYNYVRASRIVFEPSITGTYYIETRHANPAAAGANTGYSLTMRTGYCNPDGAEADGGDNAPGDASTIPTDNTPTNFNFCADPTALSLGDQDWSRFDGVAGGTYFIETAELGPNTDTVLKLYGPDGTTLIDSNDDAGPGRSAGLVFTPTVSGDYYVQVTQYNSNVNGPQTEYQLRVNGQIPPTPTPTPTPTATPTPAPTATPQVDLDSVRTLILVNRSRMTQFYGESETEQVIGKLFDLADHERVDGAVVQVESNPNVAAAYAAWTANEGAPSDSENTLLDNDLANGVTSAVRSLVLDFASSSPSLAYVVIVGDDRMIPFRRVPEGQTNQQEDTYAGDVTASTTIAAALAQNMVLTDDYFVDKDPSQWQGNEMYLPDYAIGRLIETPDEIMGFIDSFTANPVNDVSRILVTGYDFVQDSADLMGLLYGNDFSGPSFTVDDDLIGSVWPTAAFRGKHLESSERFDIHAINGHATHVRTGSPQDEPTDPTSGAITAGDVLSATTDYAGALVYAVGCHAGLNDPGLLDLPQAFLSRGANYVANTGYGWGGGGIVYSEALMRNYTRELLRDTSAEIGPSLVAAKQKYWTQAFVFRAYDAKVLMQSTLYGLPMAEVTSGGTLSDDDPFPSATTSISPPSSFGEETNVGSFSYGLPNSFGAFGEESSDAGTFPTLDGNTFYNAGTPVLPNFYADVSAPAAGRLRGVLFRGGFFSDTVGIDPVVALADNEYISDSTEPIFAEPGWYPPVPFALQSSSTLSTTVDSVSLALGQFNNDTNTQRLYDRMTFSTLYSNSDDQILPQILFVDGILDADSGTAEVKVEATDNISVTTVVAAFTSDLSNGTGTWSSLDLALNPQSQKWTGVITATAQTRYFIQAADAAGNVAVSNNKGRYYSLLPPLPLADGTPLVINRSIYLPLVKQE